MKNKLCSNLLKLRKAHRRSQKEIARLLSVNEMTIRDYEHGEKVPPLRNVIKLADFFHVTIDDFVRGDVEGTADPPPQKTLEKPVRPKNSSSTLDDIGVRLAGSTALSKFFVRFGRA